MKEEVQIKSNLETIVLNSLKKASDEMEFSGENFTEESLRYIVMKEISENGYYGTFPNRMDNKRQIQFEYNYFKGKKNPKEKFMPDIVSLERNERLLVIELKINRTRGSLIKDLKKCIEYLHENKGEMFDMAAMIFTIPKHKQGKEAWMFEEMLITTIRENKTLINKIHNVKNRLIIGFVEYLYDYRFRSAQYDSNDKNGKYSEPKVLWIDTNVQVKS